jgi:hypothetical protein
MALLQKHSLGEAANSNLGWILRYSALLKNRGIVHDKAFVLALESC